MIIQLQTFSIRLMAEEHEVVDTKMVFRSRGSFLCEIPLEEIVKISNWGVVTYALIPA